VLEANCYLRDSRKVRVACLGVALTQGSSWKKVEQDAIDCIRPAVVSVGALKPKFSLILILDRVAMTHGVRICNGITKHLRISRGQSEFSYTSR
jgi:hypothetical protein